MGWVRNPMKRMKYLTSLGMEELQQLAECDATKRKHIRLKIEYNSLIEIYYLPHEYLIRRPTGTVRFYGLIKKLDSVTSIEGEFRRWLPGQQYLWGFNGVFLAFLLAVTIALLITGSTKHLPFLILFYLAIPVELLLLELQNKRHRKVITQFLHEDLLGKQTDEQ